MKKTKVTKQLRSQYPRVLSAVAFALCFAAAPAQGQSTETFTEWQVPSPMNCAFGIFAASPNVIYFTDAPCSSTPRVGRLNMLTNKVTVWTGGGMQSPQGLVVLDGMILFADQTAGTINMLNPSANQLSTWALPNSGSGPLRMVARCREIFFTEQAGRIGTLNLLNNEITEWTVPGGANVPLGIAASSDGEHIWFSQHTGAQLGVLNTIEKTFHQWTIPSTLLTSPFIQGVAISPKGGLFFADNSDRTVGLLNPSANGVTLWATPVSSAPTQLVAYTSSWDTVEVNFADQAGNSLWKLLPAMATGTTSTTPVAVTVTEPSVTIVAPTTSMLTESSSIVEPTVTTVTGIVSGDFEHWMIPTVNSNDYAIARLPGGGLAFTEANGNKIGTFR